MHLSHKLSTTLQCLHHIKQKLQQIGPTQQIQQDLELHNFFKVIELFGEIKSGLIPLDVVLT